MDLDPLNPLKKLQNLIHRDEATSSESPTVLTPGQTASLANTVTTLNIALNEEEEKRKKLSSEYKDLESHCASETKSHLDQIDQLRKENTELRKENTEHREEIARLYSNIDKMEGNGVSEVPVEELDSKEKIEVRSPGSLKSDSSRGNHAIEPPNNCFETPTQPIQPTKDVKPNNAMEPVIDISDSDSENTASPQVPSGSKMGWYYMDPKGMQQGPFSMNHLRAWEQEGFFDKNFKVWRVGQSIRDAILLSDITQSRFYPGVL